MVQNVIITHYYLIYYCFLIRKLFQHVMERKSTCWGKKSLIVFILAILCLVGVVLILVLVLPDGNCPQVTATCGKVRGVCKKTRTNRTIHEFLYVPYAVPPVKAKRWTHSEMQSGSNCWVGTYNASSNSPKKCKQMKDYEPIGDEDCLHLSVRTPDLHGNLPVIVWIHGGSLLNGYADNVGYSFDAELTEELNVVTVNINYRLNAFGFLSLPELWQDGENYGNFGFSDSIAALKWIQENIKHFGGNNENVTVMGESSGGTIVLGLVLSKRAKGLFSNAISLSAAPLWKSTYKTAFDRNANFSTKAGCSPKTFTDMKDRKICLKNTPADTILESVDDNRGWGFYDFPLSKGILGESMDYNVIEPIVIPFPPQDLKDHSNVADKNVNVIIGNTAQEAGYNAFIYESNILPNWTEMENLLKMRLATFGESQHLESLKSLYNFNKSSDSWWPQLSWDTMVTDIRATCPLNTLNAKMSESKMHTMYRLYVEHRPSSTVGERWDAIHGWDTEAFFNFKYENWNISEHDKQLKRSMRTLINDTIHNRLGSYGGRTLYLRNSDPWLDVNNNVPQESNCSELNNLGYGDWGWQN